MTKLFNFLLGLIWIAPVFFAALGVVLSSRLSNGRWIIHCFVFATMPLVLPAAIYFQGIIDPTTVEYPGPGEGFLVLVYLMMMTASAFYYAAFAWVTYRKHNRGRNLQAPSS